MNRKVKIDTKEKFHVITPVEAHLSANLTDNLSNLMHEFLENPIKSIVFNAENVESIEKPVADCLAALQGDFQAENASFVICCLKPAVRKAFLDWGLLDVLNITPTESEAWDIVQMEEIERELFGNETEE